MDIFNPSINTTAAIPNTDLNNSSAMLTTINIGQMITISSSAVGTILNVAGLAVLAHTRLNFATKVSVVNLTLGNLLTCAVSAATIAFIYISENNQSSVLCHFTFELAQYCMLQSHVNVLLVTSNNLCIVKFPFIYQTITRRRYMWMFVLSAWLGTLGVVICFLAIGRINFSRCSKQVAIVGTMLLVLVLDVCSVVENGIVCRSVWKVKRQLHPAPCNSLDDNHPGESEAPQVFVLPSSINYLNQEIEIATSYDRARWCDGGFETTPTDSRSNTPELQDDRSQNTTEATPPDASIPRPQCGNTHNEPEATPTINRPRPEYSPDQGDTRHRCIYHCLSLVIVSVTSLAISLPMSIVIISVRFNEDAFQTSPPVGLWIRLAVYMKLFLIPCLYLWRYLKREDLRNRLGELFRYMQNCLDLDSEQTIRRNVDTTRTWETSLHLSPL